MEAGSKSSSPQTFQFFFTLSFAILLFMSNIQAVASGSSTNTPRAKAYKRYIITACKSATYPEECFKSLSPYAAAIKNDPVRLYKVTLYITIKNARKTSLAILSVRRLKGLSPTEKAIISDCAENVGNAVDVLSQSLAEMSNAQRSADRQTQMENVRTWVSAALTGESTCTDEFDGQKVCNEVNKNIKKTLFNLAKLTSNCLALIDSLITY